MFCVIIPAFNEERMIGACLDSMTHMNFPKDQLEVIVVDNGSRDRTAEIVRSYQDRLPIQLVSRSGVNVSALRNLGARTASGNYFAFLDADCIAPPEWLSNAASVLEKQGGGLAGAPYQIPANSSWVGRAWYSEKVQERGAEVSYLAGGDIVISRDSFSSIGGFDAALETNEDYEFCQRAKEAGLPVRAYPELAVVHLGTPQTLRVFFRKQSWHGSDVFKVFLRDFPKLRNLRAVGYALYFLACLIGVVAGIVSGFLSGGLKLLLASLLALCAGAFASAFRQSLRRNRLSDLPALTALFFVYGVARVCSLIRLKLPRRSSESSESPGVKARPQEF